MSFEFRFYQKTDCFNGFVVLLYCFESITFKITGLYILVPKNNPLFKIDYQEILLIPLQTIQRKST